MRWKGLWNREVGGLRMERLMKGIMVSGVLIVEKKSFIRLRFWGEDGEVEGLWEGLRRVCG